MHLLIPLTLLFACGPYTGSPTNDSGTAGALCAKSTQEPASSAAMTIFDMRLNVSNYQSTFVPGKTYEGRGYNACWDSSAGRMTWIFEANGDAAGQLDVVATETGSLDLRSTTSTYTLTLFDQNVTFLSTDFVSGTFVVDMLDPLDVNIIGQTQKGGDSISVSLAAEADLP